MFNELILKTILVTANLWNLLDQINYVILLALKNLLNDNLRHFTALVELIPYESPGFHQKQYTGRFLAA